MPVVSTRALPFNPEASPTYPNNRVAGAHLWNHSDKYRQAIQDLKMSPEEFSAEYPMAIPVTPETLQGW